MPETLRTANFVHLRMVRRSGALLLLLWFMPAANAQESAVGEALLEFVGLNAQIERSAATIIDETTGARLACDSESLSMQELTSSLNTLFAPDVLRRAALKSIDTRLTEAEKNQLHDWMQSPLGQKIYAAEAATEEQDMAAMQQREKALIASPAWTEERQKIIYRVLRVTRVHAYVAALNSALTSVVKMASACQRDRASLENIEIAIRRDRADEVLIGRMMLPSFVVPTGVVFEALSDEELQQYFLFSSTPTAQKWYTVVIETVRSMLLDKVPSVREYLQRETLPNGQ